jgi:small subunit ribosomal protein S6
MAIISNAMTANEAKARVKESLTDKITGEFGGKVTFEDFWGEKGFAYRINGEKWGYYVVLRFEMTPTKVAAFRRELNIDTKVVRFLITAVTKHTPAASTYVDIQKKAETLVKKEEKPVASAKKIITPIKTLDPSIDEIFDAEL